MTIRLGLVGPLPPPAGGMARQTLQLAKLLEDQGVQVNIVRTNREYWPTFIGKIKGLRAIFRLFGFISEVNNAAKKVELIHLMANSGWSWHLFAAPVIWIAWMHKVPVLVNYRGGEAENFFSKSWKWIRPTINKTKAVAVPSEFLSEVFNKYGVETVIVPNILNLELFTKSRASQNKNETDDLHIVVTRNLERIYGIEDALRAFALISSNYPNARLTVAGSGPDLERLEWIANDLSIADSVTFCGRLEHSQIAELYQSADLMINPSLADNSPNSLIEAMACGVPVVSTNVGGIPYLIKSEFNGLLIEAGDSKAICDAACRILTDEGFKERLTRQGSLGVEKFDQKLVIEQLLNLYKEITN